MRKPVVQISFLLVFIAMNTFPLQGLAQVNWLTWEEVEQLSLKEPRKIFVDVYTRWCNWCKKMDDQTFQHPQVFSNLNDNFYCIRFNAEYAESINFRGQTWHYQDKKGYHELAAAILNERMSYPSIVFLDENKNLIQSIPGFKTPQDFDIIVSYFASGHYLKTPWAVYKQQFVSSIKD